MDSKTELYTTAYMGDQAEKFWKSDLGEYLITRIDEEIKHNIEDLIIESGIDKIRVLQSNIDRCRSIGKWFSELINEGQQARTQLEETE